MKYYINKKTGSLLIDENDYTPYLADRGYEEITKEEYDQKNEEMAERFRREHEAEFELERRRAMGIEEEELEAEIAHETEETEATEAIEEEPEEVVAEEGTEATEE